MLFRKPQKKFKVLYFSDKNFARAARLVVSPTFVSVADVGEVILFNGYGE